MSGVDFNVRPSEFFDTKDSILEVGDELSMLVIHIEMLLYTQKGDVLGEPDMGIGLDDLLWERGFSNYQVEQEIILQIQEYIPLARRYEITTNVSFFRGSDYNNSRDVAQIDILVDGRGVFSTLAY